MLRPTDVPNWSQKYINILEIILTNWPPAIDITEWRSSCQTDATLILTVFQSTFGCTLYTWVGRYCSQ